MIFIEPELKEMIRYQAYKEHISQNALIGEILDSYLEAILAEDKHFKELAEIS